MVDELRDIETLENALIALQEGAGDEKRSAIFALERMLERKNKMFQQFEMFAQLEDGYGEGQVV